MDNTLNPNINQEVRERAERIYKEKFQGLEKTDKGKFITINLTTEEGFVAESADESIKKAKEKSKEAFLFTLRIGYPDTFSFSKRNLASIKYEKQ